MAIHQSASPQPRFADRLEMLLQTIARKLSSRPKGAIAAVGIFFAVAIFGVFLADLHARYRAEIDHAAHSARDYAEILAEHTALTFEAVDRALRRPSSSAPISRRGSPCRARTRHRRGATPTTP
jgi:hypothetical protein